jgi:drug/metabolite transporter (DMT)-like permease
VSIGAIGLAIFIVVGMSAGQVMFKVAAGRGSIVDIAASPYLWIAGGLYAAVTVAWVLLLREIDLARAYPLMAACFVFVPVSAALLLGERLGPLYGVGVVLILVGIFLTLRA